MNQETWITCYVNQPWLYIIQDNREQKQYATRKTFNLYEASKDITDWEDINNAVHDNTIGAGATPPGTKKAKIKIGFTPRRKMVIRVWN